jgi:ferrous iron transport protein B
VGVFGAGTVVDWLENGIFGQYINPFVERLVRSLVPWRAIQELLVGEYGVWTLGVTYAVALILPIVNLFLPHVCLVGGHGLPAAAGDAD